LERDYFSIHRLDWHNAIDEPGGIEFNLPVFKSFRLFRQAGFEVLDFIEIQSPTAGKTVKFFATGDWAHRYPSEQVLEAPKATQTCVLASVYDGLMACDA
jgi:hypothetical protein